MDTGKIKNMVVLKDIPSNLIDEAIIILKPNKTIKSFDYIKSNEDIQNSQGERKNNPKDYIVNEAEMVIANYIKSLEKQEDVSDKNVNFKKIQSRYNILKTCTFALTGILIINAILNFLKI